MNILIENNNSDYQHRVDYVIDFINEHMLCASDVTISTELTSYDFKVQYASDTLVEEDSSFLIPAQRTIFSDSIIDSQNLVANEYLLDNTVLYSVETGRQARRKLIINNVFQFDLLEMIFFHLSRYEEFHCHENKKDRWDMMNESDQFLVRHNLEKKPVVDHLIKCFLKAIGLRPKENRTKIRITHDIDLINKFKSPLSFLRFNAYYLKNSIGYGSVKNLWGSYYRKIFEREEPYNVFEEILIDKPLEKEIYFLIGGKTSVDTPLDTNSSIFKNAIRLSKQRGYVIGIHPSYATWKNGFLLEQEKELLENIINCEIKISRQHYLHFSFDKTISILEEAGLSQDSTIGFNTRLGFRAGTGVGFFLFDLTNDRITSILEKPLALMDSSLFEESQFNAFRFEEIFNHFISSNRYDTEITCNFHNSRFDDANMLGLPQWQLYNKLINV